VTSLLADDVNVSALTTMTINNAKRDVIVTVCKFVTHTDDHYQLDKFANVCYRSLQFLTRVKQNGTV